MSPAPSLMASIREASTSGVIGASKCRYQEKRRLLLCVVSLYVLIRQFHWIYFIKRCLMTVLVLVYIAYICVLPSREIGESVVYVCTCRLVPQ